VFAARRYGVKTRDVTLWPFGGIASMERMPDKPYEELIVAVAGPTVNVAIAALLLVWVGSQLDVENLMKIGDPSVSLAVKVMGANIILVVFNMIPAFPMDGGRVLRALLAMRMGNVRATEMAAKIGQGFAIVFGVLGIFYNPMLVIIAAFVFLAASGEAAQARIRAVTQDALVTDAMITDFQSLPVTATAGDAADALIRTTQKEFPVIDDGGRLRGALTRDATLKVLKEIGPDVPVLDVMQADVPTIGANAKLDSAVRQLMPGQQPIIGVTDVDGKLVGLLTLENLGEMTMVRSALSGNGPAGRGP
jgi:CBS domain-containing protein